MHSADVLACKYTFMEFEALHQDTHEFALSPDLPQLQKYRSFWTKIPLLWKNHYNHFSQLTFKIVFICRERDILFFLF